MEGLKRGSGATPPHCAILNSHIACVAALLEAKADINCTDRWNGTPLRDAVTHGHTALAKLLRGRGGELGYDEATASGELCEMARQGRVDMLRTLLICGASVNAADYDSRTALHLAASVGNLPIAQTLLTSGAAIDGDRDADGGCGPSICACPGTRNTRDRARAECPVVAAQGAHGRSFADVIALLSQTLSD